MLLQGIATFKFIQAATSFQRFDDILPDPLVIIRNQADPLFSVQCRCIVVDYDAIKPCSNKSCNDKSEWVYRKRRAADTCSGDSHGSTDIEMKIFVHNLGKDIESPRGSIDIEQDSLRNTKYQNKAEKIHPQTSHYSGLTGRNKSLVWHNPADNFREWSENHGRIHGFCPEFMIYKKPRQHQQNRIYYSDEE